MKTLPFSVLFVLVLTAISACTADVTLDEGDTFSGLDATIEWTTDRENVVAFHTPEYDVPPYTDQTLCYFDTYSGEEAGVFWAGFYQNVAYGHHVVLMSSSADEDDWPDGTMAAQKAWIGRSEGAEVLQHTHERPAAALVVTLALGHR